MSGSSEFRKLQSCKRTKSDVVPEDGNYHMSCAYELKCERSSFKYPACKPEKHSNQHSLVSEPGEDEPSDRKDKDERRISHERGHLNYTKRVGIGRDKQKGTVNKASFAQGEYLQAFSKTRTPPVKKGNQRDTAKKQIKSNKRRKTRNEKKLEKYNSSMKRYFLKQIAGMKYQFNQGNEMKQDNAVLKEENTAFQQQVALLKIEKYRMKRENDSLKHKMKSLQIEYEQTLGDLGRISVQLTAKENEEEKFEFFHRKLPSPLSTAIIPVGSSCSSDRPSVEDTTLAFQKESSNSSADPHRRIANKSINPEKKKDGDPEPSLDASSLYFSQQDAASGGKVSHEFENRKEVDRTDDVPWTCRHSSNERSSTGQSNENLSFPVQQDSNDRDHISLSNVPPTSVATTLYNNYKLLMLILAQSLLLDDVVALKNWASGKFSINNFQNAADILFELDLKGVINGSDFSELRDFFESIVRIDLVYIIDQFLLGDYTLLRHTSRQREVQANGSQRPHQRISRFLTPENIVNSKPNHASSRTFRTQSFENDGADGNTTTSTLPSGAEGNQEISREPEKNERSESENHVPQLTNTTNFTNTSARTAASPNTTNLSVRTPNENQSLVTSQYGNYKPVSTEFTDTRTTVPAVVADGPVIRQRGATPSSSLTNLNLSGTSVSRNVQTVSSNGFKLSKFQRSDTQTTTNSNSKSPGRSQAPRGGVDEYWLCNHYKRRCLVKFECCDKFWSCHRCHNNQSTCGRKLKSRDTKMVKCVSCGKVQEFGQYCCDCNAKFANYYCGLCKHLTGKDDHPYHCEKCGICRIHGDRSFHCDVCGVCLDVQLRGNHKCREDSAHDECCICLEDAFTGCQILPCSHKVHKECATQMIQSGIMRCPICRESFAHKLERKPPINQRRHFGK